MSNHVRRASMLLNQGRHELAEEALRLALIDDNADPTAHCLLAICLAEQRRVSEALASAREAVAVGPDVAFVHSTQARILVDAGQLDEAEQAIHEGIRLDPEDADAYAVLASIHAARSEWSDALAVADRGLACDPEDDTCSNLRAIALVKLGRRAEAAATMTSALQRDPENAVTQANQGWAALHDGQPKVALEHFREALRLDPNQEWARQGILEALRARHFIYRLMLKYFMWMSTLSGRGRWLIIIGAYAGFRILRQMASSNPAWAPWLWPVLGVYIGFALLSWVAKPMFDLLLRLHPVGRYALDDDDIASSNAIGGLLGGAFVAGGTAWWLDSVRLAFVAMVLLLLVLAVGSTLATPSRSRARAIMRWYLTATAGLGALTLFCMLMWDDRPWSHLMLVFSLACGLSSWVANAVIATRGHHPERLQPVRSRLALWRIAPWLGLVTTTLFVAAVIVEHRKDPISLRGILESVL